MKVSGKSSWTFNFDFLTFNLQLLFEIVQFVLKLKSIWQKNELWCHEELVCRKYYSNCFNNETDGSATSTSATNATQNTPQNCSRVWDCTTFYKQMSITLGEIVHISQILALFCTYDSIMIPFSAILSDKYGLSHKCIETWYMWALKLSICQSII